MTAIAESQAIEEGARAFRACQTLGQCPYPPDNLLADFWARGWIGAEQAEEDAADAD